MLQNQSPWPKIALGVAICQLAGVLGGLLSMSGIREWYPALQKPTWTPPDAVFAPVWTILYAMMGVALGLIWAKGLVSSREKRAFAWFWGQLALNVLWSAVFFGFRSPAWGYVVILLLWLALAATMWLFSKISRASALWLAPCLAWVTFASMLNFGILSLNVVKPGVQRMDADPRNGPVDPNRRAPVLKNEGK
ncbi:MAG: tryptophan-rich sensory protein [Armatimonadetes bacterium]|nr:tryptophan-rich sensory protein [Armatimonadota bacterium]